ncbi:FUSC family protein [Plantactinospora sp. S1510]|uniref:FUSC family protein n=1 Tax=Plantactinospora alkalitolerans TaxID=2789879 RepID=A0ABS0GQK9_9ACTN|nr:FUSC family protein [Plantactinospora alkalitolerans]MBF9128445.1 FUSC family protein [Plantactinospora alkalitolerans]
MTRIGFVDWLRRRDPGYRVLRRGVRLSLVAAAGLFGGRYGLDNPLLGLYTLFGAIATGFISQLPGGPVQQARTLLTVLPATWVLVTVGSFLAFDTWAAVAGMLLVGFVVPFAGVAGPRALGLATGLQLFYIASSFPPYAPESLPSRLAGVTVGVGLLAVAELVLWPDPAPPSYRERLAGVAAVMVRFLELAAGLPGGAPVDRAELARRRTDATRALAGIWLPNLPPAHRPASAAAQDRALRHGDMLLRQVLDQADRVCGVAGDLRDDELARLLRQVTDVVRDAGRTLHGGTAPIGLEQLAGLETRIRAIYERPTVPPDGQEGQDGTTVPRLRLDAVVLHVADTAVAFGIAARIAVGLPPPARSPKMLDRDEFWYARRSPLSLYWWQFRYHLTTRSVYLQGAVRVALALGAARVVAGFLHLNHGFWVLLAILTLMRTSAVDTRTALRPVLLGTLLGAVVGSLLLTTARTPQVLLVALPLFMVLTFAVSPLLRPLWGQSLFTVLFILVFAQAGPASLRIAGARLLDVAIGASVGVLAGLLLWPRGGSGEMRRAMARYLEVSAAAAQEATRLLTGRESRQDALTEARQASVLADASFSQYQMERHDPKLPPVNWQAALTAGNRMYLGAESRLHRGARARLPRVGDAAGPLDEFAGRLRHRYGELARQLQVGRLDQRAVPPPPPDDFPDRLRAALAAGESREAALNLVDVEVWLTSAGNNLDLIQPTRSTG